MRLISTLGSVAAIAIGLAAMSVDTWSNIEFQTGQALTPERLLAPEIWTSLTAAVVVVAISTAAALSAAGIAWRGRRFGLAAGLFVAFVCGAAYSLSATLDRVATSKDGRVHEARSHNLAISEAQAAVAEWEGTVAREQAGINRECDGRNPASLDRRRWPNCRGHADALEAATARLRAARAHRAALGAEVTEDSGADRIAALIPGLTPKQVTLYQPVLLPAALFLFGNLLVAFGFAGLTPSTVARSAPVSVEVERPMRDITPAHPVVAALEQAGRPVNNGELAQIAGWSDATAHRRVNEAARQGLVTRTRNGREVAITLSQ